MSNVESFYEGKRESYAAAPLADNAHAKIPPLVGSGRRVLDVGCGSGQLGAAIRARGNQVVGLEVSASAASDARRRLDAVHVGNIESGSLPEPLASFDVIVCADVIEHLFDPRAALARLLPYLTADGRLIASLPNVAHFSVRLGLLRGRFEYRDVGICDTGHLRFFTLESALRLLRETGLVAHLADVALSIPNASPAVRRVVDLVARLPQPMRLRHAGLLAAQLILEGRRAPVGTTPLCAD